MKIKQCQVKSEALSWDDLIEFSKAKIAEMQDGLRSFEESKRLGRPWPGRQSASQTSESCHSV
jgi:hypothetical protein